MRIDKIHTHEDPASIELVPGSPNGFVTTIDSRGEIITGKRVLLVGISVESLDLFKSDPRHEIQKYVNQHPSRPGTFVVSNLVLNALIVPENPDSLLIASEVREFTELLPVMTHGIS